MRDETREIHNDREASPAVSTARPRAARALWARSMMLLAAALGLVVGATVSAWAQTLDPEFNPNVTGHVWVIREQLDGKLIIGGDFTHVGGIQRSNLARLYADGTLDPSFNPGTNGRVQAMAIQADGKVLVGGAFTKIGGGGTGTTDRNNLARLNADGTVDSFNPGSNAFVAQIVLEPSSILVGGAFSTMGGGGLGNTTRQHLARVFSDGSLDVTFNPGTNGSILAIALLGDGRMIVGGGFTTIGGGGFGSTSRSRLALLSAQGNVDTNFNPGTNATVNAIAIQPDGKYVVGGDFTTAGGGGTGVSSRSRIARINTDGTADSFDPGANGTVYQVVVRDDGRIVLGGSFTTLGGGGTGSSTRNFIGSVNADGSLTAGVDFGANSLILALQMQGGRVLMGGQITTAGGGGAGTTARSGMARFYADVDLTRERIVDLNNDGNSDVFLYDPVSGGWAMQNTTAGGSFTGSFGIFSPNFTVLPARFNDDNFTDFFLINATTGQWFTVVNNGAGGFTVRTTAQWWPNWQRYIADINGDGLSDVFLWDPPSGHWFKCLTRNDGSFNYVHGFWTEGWEAYPMRYNDDRRQDFFLFNRGAGQWFWVLGQENDFFSYPLTGFWSTEWQFSKGDFNADGLSDLMLFRPGDGFWFIGTTTGAASYSFTSGFFSTGFEFHQGDLNADGRTDLLLHNPSSGQWFELTSNGVGGFVNSGTGFWTLGYGVYMTDFNGDSRADVLLYNASNGFWYQGRNLSLNAFTYTSGAWNANVTVVPNSTGR